MQYYSRGVASLFSKMRPVMSAFLALVLVIQAMGPGFFAVSEAEAFNNPPFCSGGIFSDRFDRNGNSPQFSNWTSYTGNWSNSSSNDDGFVDGDTGQNPDLLTKAISTSYYSGLSLDFKYKADSFESGDVVALEWTTDGSTWNAIVNGSKPPFTDGDETNNWTNVSVNLPAGANDASGFQFRFKADLSSSNDKFWLDDVCLKGTENAKVTVIKNVVNDNGGTNTPADFVMNISGVTAFGGNSFAGSSNGVTKLVTPGTYSVTETGPSGYTLSMSGDCTNKNINAGQTKTCTLTNNDQAGTLVVKKVVVGGNLQKSDFSFKVNDGTPAFFEFDGQNDMTVNAGTYTVSETDVPLNYTPTYENCSEVQVANGETETCVITNTYNAPTPTTATISATKIVCDSENLLPDWANGGPNVTASTAADFIASTPERTAGCRVVPGWNFQWGPESATDAGGSFIGSALAPWTTFGPTNNSGVVTTQVPLAGVGSKIWVREELKNGFLGFTFDNNNKNNSNPESAEMYCASDVLNYDNYDFIGSPVAGETYHCVAFNVRVQPPVENTCLTPNTLGDTSEFVLGVSPEPQLVNIFADAGLSIDPILDQQNIQVWDGDANSVSTKFDVTLLAKYAGNNQVFGYYTNGNTASFVPVFRVGTHSNPAYSALPELAVNATTTVTVPGPFTSVGFALDTDGASPAKYYSQTSLNGDTSDHVAVYNPASNSYVIAFEDLPSGSWDKDHNDLVIRLDKVTCEECAPQQGLVVSGANTKVTSVKIGDAEAVVGNNPAVPVTPTTITDGYWSADDDIATFGTASWVWSEDPVQDWTVDKIVTFEEAFNVSGTATGAQLVVAADNSYEAFVNGVSVGVVATDNGHVAPAETYAVTLNPGINTLKVVVKNWAQAGEALNNPGGLIYKLTWSVLCGDTPTDPEKAKVFVKKYIGDTQAKDASLPEGTDFNIDITGIINGNVVLNDENDFSWSPEQYTSVVIGTPVTIAERTTNTGTIDPDVLPYDAECIPGKYRLVGYRSSLVSFNDALTQTLVTAPWTANVQGNTYVVVQNELCPELPPQCIPGAQWADLVISSEQGKRKNGTNVLENRSATTSIIGAPDASFYSLGFGGKVVLKFNTYILDVTGDDLSFHEVTNGVYPEETASVRVSQDGSTWYSVGTVTNVGGGVKYLDFSSTGLSWIQYVEITDTTNPALHTADADGYDLGAVDATNGVCDEPETPPQVAGVTICKVDENQLALSGWSMVLLGNKVQDDLSVPTGNVLGADSIALSDDKSYVAHATGTWTNQNGANPVDAEYSQPNGIGAWVDVYPGFVSDVLELRIANEFGTWGAYNSAHSYWRAFTPTVNGPVNFGIFDGENNVQNGAWFADNSGNILVDIYEGYSGVTGENGCVTFTDVPYGTYTLDEQLQDGWTKVSGTGSVTIDSPTESFTVVNTDEVVVVCDPETDPNQCGNNPPVDEPETPVVTTTNGGGGGGGGNWGPYLSSLVGGVTDENPEVLGATDELPGLPNTGNAPYKTTGTETTVIFGLLALMLGLGNIFLLRGREV